MPPARGEGAASGCLQLSSFESSLFLMAVHFDRRLLMGDAPPPLADRVKACLANGAATIAIVVVNRVALTCSIGLAPTRCTTSHRLIVLPGARAATPIPVSFKFTTRPPELSESPLVKLERSCAQKPSSLSPQLLPPHASPTRPHMLTGPLVNATQPCDALFSWNLWNQRHVVAIVRPQTFPLTPRGAPLARSPAHASLSIGEHNPTESSTFLAEAIELSATLSANDSDCISSHPRVHVWIMYTVSCDISVARTGD